MKRIIGFLFCSFLMLSAHAQTDGGEITAEKKYDLRPEFTARVTAQFFQSDYTVSGGVNVNNKNTYGLMLGYKEIYDDATPADIYAITSSFYYRHYFHLGKRKVCAFYVDANVGAGWVYKVDEWFPEGEDNQIDMERGEVIPFVGLHPGFRVRLYKNLHIFLGPTIGTDCLGLHLGIGF